MAQPPSAHFPSAHFPPTRWSWERPLPETHTPAAPWAARLPVLVPGAGFAMEPAQVAPQPERKPRAAWPLAWEGARPPEMRTAARNWLTASLYPRQPAPAWD